MSPFTSRLFCVVFPVGLTSVAIQRQIATIYYKEAGYSSVGRAYDCRMLQQSDGPWFDSGWPDFSSQSGDAIVFDINNIFCVGH